MIGVPAGCGNRNAESDATKLGELERVGKKVLKHLEQTLQVRHDALSEMRSQFHFKGQLSIFGFVPEGTPHHVREFGEGNLLRINSDGARFDLRQIENIANQV